MRNKKIPKEYGKYSTPALFSFSRLRAMRASQCEVRCSLSPQRRPYGQIDNNKFRVGVVCTCSRICSYQRWSRTVQVTQERIHRSVDIGNSASKSVPRSRTCPWTKKMPYCSTKPIDKSVTNPFFTLTPLTATIVRPEPDVPA